MGWELEVNLDHVQTVAKSRLGARITTLPSQRMREVRLALLFALGFDPGS
ncbi:MAG TPA: type II toxin-antitoxin system PemK/MazF family toxin [Acidobacteriota bacterium]